MNVDTRCNCIDSIVQLHEYFKVLNDKILWGERDNTQLFLNRMPTVGTCAQQLQTYLNTLCPRLDIATKEEVAMLKGVINMYSQMELKENAILKYQNKKSVQRLLKYDECLAEIQPNYKGEHFTAACPKARKPPQPKGGRKKPAKKAAKYTKTHKTHRDKHGVTRKVYTKDGVEYVKKKGKDGRMRHVLAT